MMAKYTKAENEMIISEMDDALRRTQHLKLHEGNYDPSFIVKFNLMADPYGRDIIIPKRHKSFLKARYTESEMKEVIEVVAGMTSDEAQQILVDDEADLFLKTVAQCLLNASLSGSYKSLKDLFEQVLGKPKQKAEITHKQGYGKMSDDELDKKIADREMKQQAAGEMVISEGA